MMKRIVVLLAVLLAASGATAQMIPTATLTGKVIFDGAPVPGVKITVTSPALQGTRTTTTTASGDYILPFLPPGEYKVRFQLTGMQTAERKVTLGAAMTEILNVDLRPAAVTEAIVVTAETVQTATIESTQVSTNIKQDFVEKLPSRAPCSRSPSRPGVNPNGPGETSSSPARCRTTASTSSTARS